MPSDPSPAAAAGAADFVGILLFDGTCNFCNGTVNFLIPRDRRGRLRFAALQSELGRRLLTEHGLPIRDDPESMVYIEGGRALERSDAALALCRHLDGGWPLLRAFRIVPRCLRDAVYRLVARNRYRWFGRTEACVLPTPERARRFLT